MSEAGWPCQVHSPVSRSGAPRAPRRSRAPSAWPREKELSMSNILVINASGQETRVALIEQGTISEYYLERKNEKGIVGNIYKGRVVRVLPGMQAAFVDIGLDKAAFLYVGDIVSDPTFPGFSEEMDIKAGAVEGDPLEADDLPEPSDEPLPQAAESPPSVAEVAAVPEPAQEAPAPATQEPAEVATPSPEPVPAEAAAGAQTAEPADIVDLHPDDALDDEEEDDDEELDEADAAHAAAEEVLAAEQAKASEPPPGGEPAAEAAQQQAATPPPEAGARGLPAEQRPAAREGRRGRRLRELVDRYRPPGTGFIVRTVAENEPSEKLTADIKFLLGLWNEVGKKRESMKAPACVHPDLDLILRSIRDLFSDEVEKLVIDDRSEFERVRAFVEQAAPELKERIELYAGEEPIFDEFGIEQELVRAANRKVWLKSGGYIIIDQTEALVAIDVNSGRYVGKKGAGASLEDTITKINCEAAKEIVYQLRLRNIGGIIIIDFIDLDN